MQVVIRCLGVKGSQVQVLSARHIRAATASTHPAFVAGLVQVVKERMGLVEPVVAGDLPAWGPVCAENCCLMPRRPGGHGGPGGPSGPSGHGGGSAG